VQSNLLNNDPSPKTSLVPKDDNYEPPVITSLILGHPGCELAGHAWRQRGTELICESCPYTHASYIPPDKQLYGIDDRGLPMIRSVVSA
jgi:hypothetical protein